MSDMTIGERLFARPGHFSFFEAVHLLELFSGRPGGLGTEASPAREPVRFKVRPSLVFPASEIASLEPGGDGSPPEMEVTFMGLVGPSGVLPHWYTELALERLRQKDGAMAAFLDIFHHRLVTLFYLAWKRTRLCENHDPGKPDRLTGCLMSLLGLATGGDPGLEGPVIETIIFHAGIMGTRVANAWSVESAVGYLTGVPVEVEQFVERTVEVDRDDTTRLGQACCTLGVDAQAGGYARDASGFFRVHLGPMGYDEFTRFLPGGAMLPRVFSLVRFKVGPEYEFDLKVILDRREVPPCVLGSGSRLGMTSWLKAPGRPHAEDVFVIVGERQALPASSV
ncbi:MAG TPA: type VI secretion system baseplate subunit TssG [Deltaproteobacteria bacterium]|nr:type VI secretion system baseplate subunit TssG [Deltaproteobacteria bacterium]